MTPSKTLLVLLCLTSWTVCLHGEIRTTVDHNANNDSTSAFRFKTVPRPRKADAGASARLTLADGQRDPNGGALEQLTDGRFPGEEDQPGANFFFAQGTDGGRIVMDLGKPVEVRQVNTYSWHPGTRGPQVYTLYGATEDAKDLDRQLKRGKDPLTCGWTLLAKVDTRPKQGEPGGQYGVSIGDPDKPMGTLRYLLFDVFQTENTDAFGNTFFSEIDVVENPAAADPETAPAAVAQKIEEQIEVDGYSIRIDTTETPDLTEWVRKEVVPMAKEWYPKLVRLMPSSGFEAPKSVSIIFSADMRGVAATGGTRVRCAAQWFRNNLKGEALGAVFHELVHVVQQYGRVRPSAPDAIRPPGWLVEGIADYVRWFKFQPEALGAEITRRNFANARYNGSYRITANFLNWVTETKDKELVPQLNSAIREGRYREAMWKERTGHTLEELNDQWKAAVEKKLGPPPA